MPRSSRSHPFARRAAAALMVLGLGVLTACSDEDGGDASAPDTSASTAATETPAGPPTTGAPQGGSQQQPASALEVTAVDFDFELPSDELTAGVYTIELTNEGSSSHDLVVERDGEDVAGTDSIGPGETASLDVTLEPGEYVFYCSVGNHRSMGMEVRVTVT